MNTLNSITRIEKPNIVVDNSSICDDTNEIMYNIIIYFDYEQIFNKQNVQVWKQNFICINEPLSYKLILASLIRAKYNDDEVLAIALNYNNPLEKKEKQIEHQSEYEQLQQWRSKAKEIAKTAYDFALSHNLPVSK